MKTLFLFLVVALLSLSPGALTSANAQELTSKKVCELGKPQCVTLVIREMERRYKPLAKRCDHDAVFALNYLRTTEVFQQTLNEVNYSNPTAVIRQDALFAEYYFRADDAYHTGKGNVPPVWQITFDAAQNRSVSGSGNIALGINAHIQRDLPFVLYELYLQGRPVSYEDHTRVNDFLQQVNPLKELAENFDLTIDDQDVPGDEDNRQRFETIVQWREGAFRNYERLRNASTDVERMQVVKEIEEFAAGTAQFLQQSFSYPPGTDSSERDTYCQEQQRRRLY